MEERPVPIIDDLSRPYWQSAAEGKLSLQICSGCGRFQFYPRAVCKHCLSEDLNWQVTSGTGTVYTFSIMYRAPEKVFRPELPYVVALVDLAEGPRLFSRIVDCPPEEVRIGMGVRVTFARLNDEVLLPQFRPEW